MKADAWKGKRKIKNWWEEETLEVVHQITADVPSYEVMNQCGWSPILHQNWLLLVTSEIGNSLVYGQPSYMGQVYQPHPMQDYLCRRWKKMTPQEESGKVVTQQPTSKASLRWKNRKLWLLPWMSTRVSSEDGWNPQVTWFGYRLWKEHVCKAEGMMSIRIDTGI